MPQESRSENKFSPSLSQIMSAARKLPDPSGFDKRTFPAFIDGMNGRTVEFERIKLQKKDGSSAVKWSYKGRITVDSKFTDGKL